MNNSLDTRLADEESTRETADTSLTTRLSTEETNRTTADTSLTTRLSTEESNRTTADTSLTTRLAAEENASVHITGDQSIAGVKTFNDNINVLSDLDVTGNIVSSGNLTINGSTTTLNSTTLTVDDHHIEIGSVSTPSNDTADGGGIILKGAGDKSIIWDKLNSNWTFSEHINAADGKKYKINNTDVLTSTT